MQRARVEEYLGYQRGRDTRTKMVQEREQRLIEALASGDEALIEARRYKLFYVLADRQAIIDAMKQCEQRVAHSAELVANISSTLLPS